MTRYHIVDAFTEHVGAGNPAAVVAAAEPYTDAWAQRVAAEFNLSETAFVRPLDGDGADYELRWFTPTTEVALCGHATLAAAHVLAGAEGRRGELRFSTRHSGVLTVRQREQLLWMDFPANPPAGCAAPAGLAEVLGAAVRWTGTADTGDLLVLLDDEATVRELTPDVPRLTEFAERGVIVTAAADPGQEHAFASRMFAPAAGIGEDPVTGSAHTVLGPFWAQRLGGDSLRALQCSPRGGELLVQLPGAGRVDLGGAAVAVAEGRLLC
ncbi:PhzF family phenazine biosynthesis protein [Salinifilum aidingensis]